jgi:hypothetical protein
VCLSGLGLGLGQCPCLVAGPVIGISANLNAPTRSAWGLLRSPDGETPTLYGSTLDLSDFSVSKLLGASLHYTTLARISRGFPLMRISIPVASAGYFWSELEDVA